MRDSPRDRMQETATNKDTGDSRKPMIHDADSESLRARMHEIVAYKRRHRREAVPLKARHASLFP